MSFELNILKELNRLLSSFSTDTFNAKVDYFYMFLSKSIKLLVSYCINSNTIAEKSNL